MEPIGVVRSPVTDTHQMPPLGVPADVEIYDKYAGGLLGVEGNSHVVIVSWMHLANRRTLQLDRIGPDNVPMQKGVFAVRSPARPNPLAISTARLLKIEGRKLRLERFDMIDGTQVVDVKGYTRGSDCVFSARSFWDLIRPSQLKPGRLFELVLAPAVDFHGGTCPGVVAAAKLVEHAAWHWDIPPHDDSLSFTVGQMGIENDRCGKGCLVDTVIASTGASFGNGRLAMVAGDDVAAHWNGRNFTYRTRWAKEDAAEAMLGRTAEDLFQIEEGAESRIENRQRGACGFTDSRKDRGNEGQET